MATAAAGRCRQHAVAGTLHMGLAELVDQPLIDPIEFAPQRRGQVPEPQRGDGRLHPGCRDQVAQCLCKGVRSHRIELGPHVGQALHAADQGVEFGQTVLNRRQHLLEQPRRLDRLRDIGIFHQ